jgi:hypothetical protein
MTDTPAFTRTAATRELHDLRSALSSHLKEAAETETRLRSEIRAREAVLAMSASGIDHEKVALGRRVVSIYGTYAHGGQDRAGVIADAIKQLATGEPIRPEYGDLWRVTFGTKNYDGWRGQRSDHQYGYGPRHGSVCFSVGLTPEVRKGTPADLTPEQIEAAIYLLTNLERVQAAEAEAAGKARAA